MSNVLILGLMVLGWFAMALAMLWGMLRIARRHQRPVNPSHVERPRSAHRPLSPQAVSLNA